MKRNKSGINLDEGIALQTKDEFELLYVPLAKQTTEELYSWLRNGFALPLLLGGQIGSGKSTIIQKSFLDNKIEPDIVLHFDKEGMNLSAGDFWRVALTGFIKKALNSSIDLSFCKLPNELTSLDRNDWSGFLEKLAPSKFSMDSFNEKEKLSKAIGENEDYIFGIVKEIGQRINEERKERLFIFASGIDKYEPDSAAFFSLQNVFEVLATFKTLFEVNVVHLFKASRVFSHLDKLILTVFDENSVIKVLQKRMGVYAQTIERELPVLAKWSAGNPRQAIRLLTHFEIARKKRDLSKRDAISQSIQATTRDFFGYSAKPSADLMNFLRTKKELQSSLVTLPGDKETARRAIYGNWIFITGQAIHDYWPIAINPLVKSSFLWESFPTEPEVQALRSYAEKFDMSPFGLSFNVKNSSTGIKTGEELIQDISNSNIEKPLALNLTEILDALSSALLSKDRADRVIIAYKSDGILKAARAYLFAKANTYNYQRYKHFEIKGGPKQKPLRTLDMCLSKDTDVFSFHFSGGWTEEQLRAIDKVRDRLVDYQMIWWLKVDDLKQYLNFWIQLRQLFEVFILEDEMLNSLSIADIESDLAFLKNLVAKKDSAEGNLVKNLKVVLKYLKKTEKESTHE